MVLCEGVGDILQIGCHQLHAEYDKTLLKLAEDLDQKGVWQPDR